MWCDTKFWLPLACWIKYDCHVVSCSYLQPQQDVFSNPWHSLTIPPKLFMASKISNIENLLVRVTVRGLEEGRSWDRHSHLSIAMSPVSTQIALNSLPTQSPCNFSCTIVLFNAGLWYLSAFLTPGVHFFQVFLQRGPASHLQLSSIHSNSSDILYCLCPGH